MTAETIKDWDDGIKAGFDPVEETARLERQESGAGLLDDLVAFLSQFVVYPSQHALHAHALWIVHTHLMDVWDSTPRIGFMSPEPGSGKSRALEVTELLVPSPVMAVNVTPAYLFRKVGAHPEIRPTILYDEIDTVFGAKVKDSNEEIRALLNAGHRRDAVAGRCVIKGKTVETEEIPAYCAVALAGLDDLPDTIRTRTIVIRMRKRSATEPVQPFRRRVEEQAGHALRERIVAWAAEITPTLKNVWPSMPHEIQDRDADVWEPLLAIADAAGFEWPDRARKTAVTHVTQSEGKARSLGVQLLYDMKEVMGEATELPTSAVLERLINLPESAWANLRGVPIDSRGLAQRLGAYGIVPHVLTGGKQRGYRKADFHDAWERYARPSLSETT